MVKLMCICQVLSSCWHNAAGVIQTRESKSSTGLCKVP
jgi:hypothetical protein